MLLSITFILLGLILLYYGAEWLVQGASSLALRLGMTPLIAGLTVVAFGTSSPELAVSLMATLKGQADIALGNVIGSNTFNIAFILGITALIIPLKVEFQLIKFDVPFMVATSLLFLFFFRDQHIVFYEALILFSVLIGYILISICLAKKQATPVVEAEYAGEMETIGAQPETSTGKDLLWIIVGIVVLIGGSKLFVSGAITVAQKIGISEAIIGLTVVAMGTSLPELASSIVAALKKQADIAIGNIVGSNIFNILCILGISGMIKPLQSTAIKNLDLYFMLGTAAVLIPIIWTGRQISRFEGAFLMVCYGVYLVLVWP